MDTSSTQTAAAMQPHGSLSPELRLRLYRLMYECRVLEKRAYDLFMQNLIKGTSHLALGQEAVAAGFGAAMRADDYTYCTYRGHNHTYVCFCWNYCRSRFSLSNNIEYVVRGKRNRFYYGDSKTSGKA